MRIIIEASVKEVAELISATTARQEMTPHPFGIVISEMRRKEEEGSKCEK